MNYILRHWRGELSLSVSFWINVFLLNIAIQFFNSWFSSSQIIENPPVAAQVNIALTIIQTAFFYPWQIVGLWRAANRRVGFKGKALWARIAQAIVILGVIATIGRISANWATYEEMYNMAFKKDPWASYTLELKKDKNIIHLTGGLGFGVSHDVLKILKENSKVSGIILDSTGGRLYEGRELAKMISEHNLDTYSLKGCFSACMTAFIAGRNRYIAIGANLAFHEYSPGGYGNLMETSDIRAEQEKDLRSFRRQGVSKDFLDRLFNTKSDDLWYPTVEELKGANVIHGVVNSSDLSPAKYEFTKSDLEDAFMGLSFFKTIKKYDPETYEKLFKELDLLAKQGASKIELQHSVAKHANTIAEPALSRTSTNALIQFGKSTIDTLKLLEKKDPFLCIKYLFPAQYGAGSMAFISDDQMMPMLEVLNQVIVDAYENKGPVINSELAESTMYEIVTAMGDHVSYLEPAGLQDREDYKRTCGATIEFYELIMVKEKNVAGNLMRYLFSLEE